MSGGEDWFEVYCHVNWQGNLGALAADLDGAAHHSAPTASAGRRVLTLGDTKVALCPGRKSLPQTYGIKANMRWSVVMDGIIILIAAQPRYSPVRPSLAVVVDGRTCLRYGAEACWKKVKTWVERLGGHIALATLHRVDLCLDLPGQRPDDLFRAFDEGRCIKRSRRHTSVVQGKAKTLYIGASPAQLCIYDKLAEVRAKSGGDAQELMVARRWNGRLPQCATRVEFKLRSKALRARGISTVDDYFKYRAHLVQRLTTNFCRFVRRRLTKGNQHKSPVLPLWRGIQRGFAKWAGEPSGPPPKPVRIEPGGAKLFRQIAGEAFSAAARAEVQIKTRADFERFVRDGVRHVIKGIDCRERVEHKRLELGLPVPDDAPSAD